MHMSVIGGTVNTLVLVTIRMNSNFGTVEVTPSFITCD